MRKSGVYPRVCGGTFCPTALSLSDPGLSPRVRGNRLEEYYEARTEGSIPACAGEPRGASNVRGVCRVYPRVCGGTWIDAGYHAFIEGLSPRVRGNLGGNACTPPRVRSIPACAGEPSALRARGTFGRVYPRVCGGTLSSSTFHTNRKGLSPRVRGNRLCYPRPRQLVPSIPACAGEPYWRSCSSRTVRVYPRVCGGTHLT